MPKESHFAANVPGPEAGKPRPLAERMRKLKDAARENRIPTEMRLNRVREIRNLVRRACDVRRLSEAAGSAKEKDRFDLEYRAIRAQIDGQRHSSEAADLELAWRD